MAKFWKFFEIGYLILAVILVYETITRWNSEREKAYLFLGFAILAIGMYFFKKRFRKKVEARNNGQKNQ